MIIQIELRNRFWRANWIESNVLLRRTGQR